MMEHEYRQDNFTISTDRNALDIDVIHSFLTRSYWARGVPKELVLNSIQNSLCFGLFDQGQQIGFARVVTDYTHFAYLCDVFVLEPYQGRGLGKWLIECVMGCPQLQGIRRFMLATGDAHTLYSKFGFKQLSTPENIMEKLLDRPWYRAE